MSIKYKLSESIINDLRLKNEYPPKRDIKRIMNYFSRRRVGNLNEKSQAITHKM